MYIVRRFAITGAFAFLLSAGCNLPSRDNLYDPEHAPTAVVVAGTCDSSGQNCTGGIEGSRHTLFQFDASGSSDPYGRGPLHFQWDLDGSGQFAVSTGLTPRVVTTVGLPAASLPSTGIGSAQRPVRVRILAGDGHAADAQTVVIVKNSAPLIDPGDDLYVPEGTGADVLLDACGGMPDATCTSSDPDGDTLSWTWQRIDGALPAGAVFENGGARLRFAAPTSPQTMAFRLTGTDGLTSASRITRVIVGTQFWVSTQNPNQLFRVFPEFAVALSTTGEVISSSIDPVTHEIFGASYGNVAQAFSTDLDQSRSLATFPPAVGNFFQAIAGSGTSVCAATKEYGNNQYAAFSRLDPLTLQVAAGPTYAPNGVNDDVEVHTSPISGTCWAVTSTSVYLLAADASLTPVVSGTLNNVFAAVPDAAGFLWIADATGIHRVDTAGNETAFAITATFAALAADPSGDGVWYSDSNARKLFHLHGTGSLEPLDGVDLASDGITGDPVDGSLWVFDFERTAILHLALVAGHYVEDAETTLAEVGLPELHPSVFPWRSLTVDPTRRRLIVGVISDTGGGGLLAVPSNLARAVLVPAFAGVNPNASSIEPTRGTLWSAVYTTTPFVERVSLSGRILARTDLGPDIVSLAALRDGSAWVSEVPFPGPGSNLYKLDPHGTLVGTYPLASHSVAFLAGDETRMCASIDPIGAVNARPVELTFPAGVPSLLIHPALAGQPSVYYPIPAPDGSCWFVTNQGMPNTFAAHYTAGVTNPDVTVPFVAGTTAYAADPLDSSLWVATDSGSVRSIVHVTLAGTTTTTTLALPRVRGLHVRARCQDAANPACRELWYLTSTSVAKAIGSLPALFPDVVELPQTAASSYANLTASP